jgi:hypothetical protein
LSKWSVHKQQNVKQTEPPCNFLWILMKMFEEPYPPTPWMVKVAVTCNLTSEKIDASDTAEGMNWSLVMNVWIGKKFVNNLECQRLRSQCLWFKSCLKIKRQIDSDRF